MARTSAASDSVSEENLNYLADEVSNLLGDYYCLDELETRVSQDFTVGEDERNGGAPKWKAGPEHRDALIVDLLFQILVELRHCRVALIAIYRDHN